MAPGALEVLTIKDNLGRQVHSIRYVNECCGGDYDVELPADALRVYPQYADCGGGCPIEELVFFGSTGSIIHRHRSPATCGKFVFGFEDRTFECTINVALPLREDGDLPYEKLSGLMDYVEKLGGKVWGW